MKKSKTEIIYSSDSLIRHPQKLFIEMIRDLSLSWGLAWRLFIRNISAAYRQSLLGYFWAFIPPLVTMVTWSFLKRNNVIQVQIEDTVPYPVYVLTGTVLWGVFTDSLIQPLSMMRQSSGFLTKINFPREALIIAGLGQVIFNFLIKSILLILIMGYFGMKPTMMIFTTPIGIAGLMLIGTTIGLLITPMGMLFGDIQIGLQVITNLWFLLTPIVYSPPETWPGSLSIYLNPVSPILITAREMIVGTPLTQISMAAWTSMIAALLLFIGWIIMRIAMPHLIERISA